LLLLFPFFLSFLCFLELDLDLDLDLEGEESLEYLRVFLFLEWWCFLFGVFERELEDDLDEEEWRFLDIDLRLLFSLHSLAQ